MKKWFCFSVLFIFAFTGLTACEQMERDLKNPVMTKPVKKDGPPEEEAPKNTEVTKEDMIKVYNYVLDEYTYLINERAEILRLDPVADLEEYNQKKQLFLLNTTAWHSLHKNKEKKLNLAKKYPAGHPVNELRLTMKFLMSEWKNCKQGWMVKKKFDVENYKSLENQMAKTKEAIKIFKDENNME